MALIISASIDLTKIDKSKIIQGKKGGKYYNIEIFVHDVKDNFKNDVAIAQQQSKEERENKVKKNYLGNGRKVWEGTRANTAISGAPNGEIPTPDDDLPF